MRGLYFAHRNRGLRFFGFAVLDLRVNVLRFRFSGLGFRVRVFRVRSLGDSGDAYSNGVWGEEFRAQLQYSKAINHAALL